MSPEEKELLQRVAALSEENNDMLRGMKRSMRFTSLVQWLYWLFIIATVVGAYYFVEPYLNQLVSLYDNAKSSLTGVNFNASSVLQNLPKLPGSN